jgi:hypothetical protein
MSCCHLIKEMYFHVCFWTDLIEESTVAGIQMNGEQFVFEIDLL